MVISNLLLLLFLLGCSFFISGSETALFALSAQQRRLFATSSSRMKRLAENLMRHPHKVLMTVLVANTTVNIGIFAVSYTTFNALAETQPFLAATGGVVSLILVIFFGEIIPKAVALNNAERIAPIVAPAIHTLKIVITPISELLRLSLVEPITRLVTPKASGPSEVSTEDLQTLVSLSAEQEIITSREHDMLQAVVALPELSVRSVMIPRVDIVAISAQADRDEIHQQFMETKLKKLPVYGRDLDDIHGLLYARDFYLNPDNALTQLLRPVKYVPEIANLLQLIRDFQRSKTQLAIAVDEFGGVSGIVTLEDVLEEIVGELDRGSTKENQPTIEYIDSQTYRLSGALSVRPWRQALGITHQFNQVDTIGGAVLAALGRLPKINDTVRFGQLSITVDKLEGRRVSQVLLKIGEQQHDSERGEKQI